MRAMNRIALVIRSRTAYAPQAPGAAFSVQNVAPPSGPDPDIAVTVARAPLRWSPANPTPVHSQPEGDGCGSQTGTFARSTTWARASAPLCSMTR